MKTSVLFRTVCFLFFYFQTHLALISAQVSPVKFPFEINGPLNTFFTYSIEFSSSVNGFVKLNDYYFAIDTIYGCNFRTTDNNVSLSVYSINSKGDTILFGGKQIKFIDPEFRVYFNGYYESGQSINIRAERLWNIRPRVVNSDADISLDIDSSTIKYFTNGTIKNISYAGYYVPEGIINMILESQSPLIIVDMKIRTKNRAIILKPSVFYLTY